MSATAVATPVRASRPSPCAAGGPLIAVADHSLLIAAAALFLAPVVFIVLTSLMTTKQALSSNLWPEPFAWGNFVDVFETAPLWRWAFNSFLYASLGTLGLLVSSIPSPTPLASALARARRRLPDRPGRADAAAPGHGRPALRDVGQLDLVGSLWPLILPNWFGDAFAIFLLRQFFPHHPAGVHRRRPRGRLRRAPHPRHRRPPAREAGDRRRRALLDPLHLERLLPAPPLPLGQPGQLGRVDRALAVPLAPPGGGTSSWPRRCS